MNTNDAEPTLKSLIESAGYTQESFAKTVGLSRASVTYYIAGQKIPRSDHFLLMAKTLNVSVKTLAKSLRLDITGIPDEDNN